MTTTTSSPPYSRKWHDAFDASAKANAAAVQFARQASNCAVTDWNIPPSALTVPSGVDIYNGLRSLANQLGDTALAEHDHRDDVAALGRVRDLRHLVESTNVVVPSILSNLVSIGIDALRVSRVEIVALTLSPAAVRLPAVDRLKLELLDDAPVWARFRVAAAGEIEVARAFRGKQFSNSVIAPMTDFTEAMATDWRATLDAASRAADAPASQTILRRPTTRPWPAYLTSPTAFDRWLETNWRVITDRHVAAVQIAARQFFLREHRWPTAVAELVPRDLPTVPKDLFSSGRVPMGYLVAAWPDHSLRPLLRFDGTGGSPPARPCIGWQVGSVQYRDLSLPAGLSPDRVQ